MAADPPNPSHDGVRMESLVSRQFDCAMLGFSPRPLVPQAHVQPTLVDNDNNLPPIIRLVD